MPLEARRLSSACLEGNVFPDDLENGTFTVTNLGALGIENFTPILNFPQVGILGVGYIDSKPVVVNGKLEWSDYALPCNNSYSGHMRLISAASECTVFVSTNRCPAQATDCGEIAKPSSSSTTRHKFTK